MNSQTPHRRIQVEIHIGADSWNDLEIMVGDIAREIRGGGPTRPAGGSTTGANKIYLPVVTN